MTLVVIPSFLRAPRDLAVTIKTIETVRATEPDIEVLVVDDGSPARELVDELSGHVVRLKFELSPQVENRGYSAAVNVGLRWALERGEDALLLNADMELLTPDWDRTLRGVLDDHGRPAWVLGALLLYPGGELVQHGGIFFSFLTRSFDHRFRYAPASLPEANVRHRCPVTGAFQWIRHECLAEVGVYDEAFCSPGDEPVLTSRHGYVRLSDLDPDVHGLVTVDHSAAGGRIIRGHRGTRWGSADRFGPGGGRSFRRSSHRFRGPLITITAGRGCARVTPGHRLRVRWTEEALALHAVYLMRRGRNWRIGTTLMSTGGVHRTFGPRIRQLGNDADEVWVLGLYENRMQAGLAESAWSADYGIPPTIFVASGSTLKRSQRLLDQFWAERSSEPGALGLLRDQGLDPRYPLLRRDASYVGGAYHGFLIHAINVMSGYMRVGIDPGTGWQQTREVATVRRELFDGEVYGLDVPPYHYYVSGGVVVHNSMGFEDVDYCLRVFAAGRDCIYVPEVRAIHHESLFRGNAKKGSKLEEWQLHSEAVLMYKHRATPMGEWMVEIA